VLPNGVAAGATVGEGVMTAGVPREGRVSGVAEGEMSVVGEAVGSVVLELGVGVGVVAVV
jgi:hypothetical protein